MRIQVYYDAVLIGIQSDGKGHPQLAVEYNGQEFYLPVEPAYAKALEERLKAGKVPGRIGLARLVTRKANGIPPTYCFDIYPDQTLRRVTELDVFEYHPEAYNVNCIGWRNETNPAGFLGPKGLVPGIRGNFVTDGTEAFDVDVPYQFSNLCTGMGSDTISVLKDFMATACRIYDTPELPRADFYNSRGEKAEALLEEYFKVAYPKKG